MRVNGPRDLPDFRLHLIDQWKPDGVYSLAEFVLRDLYADYSGVRDGTNLPPGTVEGHVQRRVLPKAALWWVEPEMCDLIAHAAPSLPGTTLTDDLLPDDDGLVRFATPLVGTMSDTGEPIATDAIVWGRGRLFTGDECVSIASYAWREAGERFGNERVGYQTTIEAAWSPTGTATWVFGDDTDVLAGPFSAEQAASTAEDRRWLAALWLLASQPLTTSATEPAYRAAAKRSARAKVASSDVRIVNVRRAATPTEPGHEHTHNPANYSHRFIVGGETGGFWRQQACGPNWSQHRPVWIEPFIKGPADKPLKIRETVKVVRGDQ
jgi:hypothetical protein